MAKPTFKKGDLCRTVRGDYNWYDYEVTMYPKYIGAQLIKGYSCRENTVVEIAEQLSKYFYAVWVPQLNGYTLFSPDHLVKI